MAKQVVLYTVLHSGSGHPTCSKGPVRAVPHMGAGRACHWFTDHGMVVPDYAAVRECLPHYWRRAWDHRGPVWFTDEPGADPTKPATCTLYNTRGKYLSTIYLQPYKFPA